MAGSLLVVFNRGRLVRVGEELEHLAAGTSSANNVSKYPAGRD